VRGATGQHGAVQLLHDGAADRAPLVLALDHQADRTVGVVGDQVAPFVPRRRRGIDPTCEVSFQNRPRPVFELMPVKVLKHGRYAPTATDPPPRGRARTATWRPVGVGFSSFTGPDNESGPPHDARQAWSRAFVRCSNVPSSLTTPGTLLATALGRARLPQRCTTTKPKATSHVRSRTAPAPDPCDVEEPWLVSESLRFDVLVAEHPRRTAMTACAKSRLAASRRPVPRSPGAYGGPPRRRTGAPRPEVELTR
jgi:hypothetical protein